MTRRKTFGTFARDGARRVAYTAAEAVQMRFDGWTELADAPTVESPDASPASTARKATAGSAAGKDDSGKNPTTTPAGK